MLVSSFVFQQLCSPQNVNCRDLEGRHSTPLHFAAGYNRVSVVEYLLHHGADVHAKDKGYIFIPLCAPVFSVSVRFLPALFIWVQISATIMFFSLEKFSFFLLILHCS